LRYNKVFDIKDRKRFCSNLCFKASQFLENQLPSCPIWLLDEERPHKLELYQQNIKSFGLGNEVVFEDQNLKDELIKCKMEFSNITDNHLSHAIRNLKVNDEITDKSEKQQAVSEKEDCSSIIAPAQVKRESISNIKPKKLCEMSQTRLEAIEQSLQQWLTLDTLKYLFGPKRCVSALSSSSSSTEDSIVLNELRAKEALSQKYYELCHKLDREEILDNALDAQLVHETQKDNNIKGKLPSFEHLAKETEQFSMNVRSFYQGQMEILAEPVDEKSKVPHNKANTNSEIIEDAPSSQEYSLPLVDSQSQAALRRQIVLGKLNKVNYAIFQMLELKPTDISTELRHLVATFNLQADNINFKPVEWTLVLLIILHLLAFKLERIQEILQKESSKKCLATILLPFSKPVTYFTHLTNNLMDVNKLSEIKSYPQ